MTLQAGLTAHTRASIKGGQCVESKWYLLWLMQGSLCSRRCQVDQAAKQPLPGCEYAAS